VLSLLLLMMMMVMLPFREKTITQADLQLVVMCGNDDLQVPIPIQVRLHETKHGTVMMCPAAVVCCVMLCVSAAVACVCVAKLLYTTL
jgi:hypothetical protein